MDNKDQKDPFQKEKEIIFDALNSTPEQIIELDLVAQAISELQKTKEALRISEEKYRLVFAHVPLGILHFNSHGIITACNENFLVISGARKEQLIGSSLAEVLDRHLTSAIENAITGTVGHYEGEYVSKYTNKTTPVRVNFAPIIHDNGTINGGIGIFEDITDRKQIERIFFHDILNTAGNLNNMLEILDDESLSEQERKDLMKVLDEIAKRIIDEIQTHKHLVSAEKSKIKLNIQKVSSMSIIKKMYDTFNHPDVLRNKKFILSAESNNIEFETDEILIGRVLSNMIKNAIEASSQSDTITLKCSTNENQVIISVHNKTVIPDDIQKQIFTHLVSTKGTGRGLGLYSMKLLTEKYLNGEISFKSNKEEGTTFTVKYPMRYINE